MPRQIVTNFCVMICVLSRCAVFGDAFCRVCTLRRVGALECLPLLPKFGAGPMALCSSLPCFSIYVAARPKNKIEFVTNIFFGWLGGNFMYVCAPPVHMSHHLARTKRQANHKTPPPLHLLQFLSLSLKGSTLLRTASISAVTQRDRDGNQHLNRSARIASHSLLFH